MTWLRIYWPVVLWLAAIGIAVGLLVALYLADLAEERRSDEDEAIEALRRLYAGLDDRGAR